MSTTNTFQSVDPRVMARNAGALREEKMRGSGRDVDAHSGRSDGIRQMKRRAVVKKMTERDLREAMKKKEEKMNIVQQGSGKLLSKAWLYLLPSWGLTLLWINIHAFMRMIPGVKSVFCRIGSEWVPKSMKTTGGNTIKSKIKSLGFFEKLAIVFLDVFIVLAFIFFLAVLGVLYDLLSGWGIFKLVWEITKDGVKKVFIK